MRHCASTKALHLLPLTDLYSSTRNIGLFTRLSAMRTRGHSRSRDADVIALPCTATYNTIEGGSVPEAH